VPSLVLVRELKAKETQVTSKSVYVKLVFLMLVVAAFAVALGGEPWGPN
jgi:hypothetical protein